MSVDMMIGCAKNVKDEGSFPMSVDMMIGRVLRM